MEGSAFLMQPRILQDGPNAVGEQIKIKGDTLLVWIDLEPQAYFCHDTLYILISKQGIRILEGQWWPVLNDRNILYEDLNKVGVISPFILFSQDNVDKE